MEKPQRYLVVSGPDGFQASIVEGDEALPLAVAQRVESIDSLDEAQDCTREMVARIMDPKADWRTEETRWHTEDFEDGFLHVIAITD